MSMAQYITQGSIGMAYVVRNGLLVPQRYRRCELGEGWTHWMTNECWNASYKELEENRMFTCEHPQHRNYQVHDSQARCLRGIPAAGRA